MEAFRLNLAALGNVGASSHCTRLQNFCFNITLPTDWSQLTDKQLTFLFEQLSKNRPTYDVETRCLIKFANLVIIDQLPDGSFIVRKRNNKYRVFRTKKLPTVVLSARQVFAATQTLKFIEQLPSNPIRISRIGRHRALPADFMEVPFEKYLYCDNLYQGYLHTKSEDILTQLAQVLYDCEHLRPNTAQKIGVFYWFASLKSFFARKFHHFLQPIPTEDPNLLGSPPSENLGQVLNNSMNSQIRALTKGDITKEKLILSLDTWRALTELDAKAQDAEEMRKLYKS